MELRIEEDEAIFKAGYPGIVPVLIEEHRGRLECEVYAGAEDAFRAYLARFEGRLFSERALRSLAESLDGYLEAHGYERDKKGTLRWYNSYELREAEQVDRSKIRSDSHLLTEALLAKGIGNRTTFPLSELLEKSLPAFVTLSAGEVVSIAAINEQAEEGLPEITVETAVAFRKKGFAASNAAALAAYLTEQGRAVAYCCRGNHTGSNRIARGVGFEKVGRFYAIAAYCR